MDGLIGGSGNKYFYETDHLGSPMVVTDQYGEVVWRGDFAPFGEKIEGDVETGIFVDTHGFTGKDWDEDAGLYYFNARWYDPELGRFVSEDQVDDPNNPNLYVYCANDPLVYRDPTGNVAELDTYQIAETDTDKEDNLFQDAVDTAYAQRSDPNDPLWCLKDIIVLGKELFGAGVRWFNQEMEKEYKQMKDVAKSLLEIDGVGKDDPDYKEKLQQKINELFIAENSEYALDMVMGLSGGLKIKGAGTAAATTLKKLFPNLTGKIDDYFGKYKDVKGHHVHAKSGFFGSIEYDPRTVFLSVKNS